MQRYIMKWFFIFLLLLSPFPTFSLSHWVNAVPDKFEKLLNMGKFSFPAQVWWELNFSGGIAADPVVSGDIMFVASKDGSLNAVDIPGGSLRWKFSTGAAVIASPAVENERVYCVNVAGTCIALHSETGDLIWRRQVSGDPLTGVAAEQQIVCCATRKGQIYCLDSLNAEIRTTFSLPEPIHSPPLLEEGVLYIGCDDFFFYAFETAPPGKLLWQFQCDGEVRSPAVIQDQYIYFGSDDRHLYALDKKTGKRKWRSRSGNAIRSRPVIRQSLIFFTSLDNRLYAVKKKSGDQELMQYFNSRLYTSPILLDEIIVATPHGSKIGIYDLKKNKILESVTVGGFLSTSPIFSHNTLFVCTSDVGSGKLLALIKKSDRTVGHLAAPKARTPVIGIQEVKGWALDRLGVARVEIWIDNKPVGISEYGEERKDISKSYAEYVGADKSAFSYMWDSTLFPDGEHHLAIRVYNLAGSFLVMGQRTVQIINHPFSSSEGEKPFYTDFIESENKAAGKEEEKKDQ